MRYGWVVQVYGAPEELAPKISAEEYKALSPEDRLRHWYATWDPWRFTSTREGWARFVAILADGEWHEAQEVRVAMYEVLAARTRSEKAWKDAWHLIRHAYRAGLTEEDRLNGSGWIIDRKIRLRPEVPMRFLERPDYAPPPIGQSVDWTTSVDHSSLSDRPVVVIPPPPTGRPKTARYRRWRRRSTPNRSEKRAS